MYYLHHFFDPDFSHMNLSPREASDGSIDYRYLGYVQNVVKGQVLAEVLNLDDYPDIRRDHRFMYKERRLPSGPNTHVPEDEPDKIVASENGYVFYHNGLICVKKVLNIRGNLGFHTGNILFVGDIAVHGDVQTGFAVQASNILVKQHVESAKLKALNNIICLGGVKGADLINTEVNSAHILSEGIYENPADTGMPLPSALLDAGGTIRLPFCERVQLRARGNIIIDGSCLHSTIYVGGNLVIKGRLQGGCVYANKIVYVEKQLGSDYTTKTRIMMGYNPFDFLALQKIESQIKYLTDKAGYFEKQAGRNKVMEQEFLPRLEIINEKLRVLRLRREIIWQRLSQDELSAGHCRVIVPGKIMPGCDIGIGTGSYRTVEESEDSMFCFENDEVVCTQPAKTVGHDILDLAGKQ